MTDRIFGTYSVATTVAVGTVAVYASGVAIQREKYELATQLACLSVLNHAYSLFLFSRFFPQEARSIRGRISTGLDALRSMTDRIYGTCLVAMSAAGGTLGVYGTGVAIQHEKYEYAAEFAFMSALFYAYSLFLFSHLFPHEARSIRGRISTGLDALRSLPNRISNFFQTRRVHYD